MSLIPSAPFAGTGHPGRQFSDRHLGCNVPTPSRYEQIADHQLSFDRKSRLLFTPKLSLPNQSSVPLRKPKLTSASKHPPLRPKPQLLRLLLLAARLHPRLTRSPLRPPLRSPRLPLSRSSFTTRSRSSTTRSKRRFTRSTRSLSLLLPFTRFSARSPFAAPFSLPRLRRRPIRPLSSGLLPSAGGKARAGLRVFENDCDE